ncbi:hypothetical protein D9756_004539 [Leucocoprinus leucothites]|uniref:Uncharacterized protein n=1 Tax=Leucocoprinus leucothites TaxID=201217 RepID=A0A8H5G9T6_9AGAR|nr:hypothetical protein D9756_004539 [Leucoagaricus leucothites]
MANPSSTSSKRLVGLGLRGIRNSPPTQMTAQIKSVLSQSSPRTSPTLSSSPTSPQNTANTNSATITITKTPSPSSTSIANATSGVVPPNPRLRARGRLRSFQGTLASSSTGGANAGVGMGGAGNSPLIESFTPSGLGLSISRGPVVGSMNVIGQKEVMRSATPSTAATVSSNGDISGAMKKTSSAAQRQVVGKRGGLEELHRANEATGSAASTSESDAWLGSGLDHGAGWTSHVDDNNIKSEGTFTDDSGDAVDYDRDPNKSLNNRIPVIGIAPERKEHSSRAEPPSQISPQMRTPIQQHLHHHEQVSLRPQASDLPRLRPTSVSPHLNPNPFVDIPFPLHPDKTFRIHTSPLAGSPMSTGTLIHTSDQSDVARPWPLASFSSTALPASSSCPFPSAASKACTSPRLSSGFKSSTGLSNILPFRSSSPSSVTLPRPATRRNSADSRVKINTEPKMSPNTPRRMYTPIYDDMYKSPPSPSSRVSSPYFERSPSSRMLLSPRVNWLRASDRDEEDDGHRETNYSTICSPSSSPLLHRRATSVSPTLSPSPRRTRSAYSSPVAKIETVLGPRERGIECIPEKRDYHCSYSRLRMSPGSLTPLLEDKSLDLGAISDVVGSMSNDENRGLNSNTHSEGDGPSLRGSTSWIGSGFDTSYQPLSGLPVTSSSSFGAGFSDLAFNNGSGSKALANTRIGLNCKVTGVSSPLANCVATWENISEQSFSTEDTIGFEDGDDCEAPMSPLLMRAKDSLLLKDVQRRKKKRTATPPRAQVQLLGQPIKGTSAFAPASPRIRWRNSLGKDSQVSNSPEVAETQSLLLNVEESIPPDPLCASPHSSPTTESQPLFPLTLTAQIQPPDTPMIRPSTRTASGSKDLDEAISPLQLSSPTFPLLAVVRDSAWVKAPLSASVSFDVSMLRTPLEPSQRHARA